MMPVVYKVLTDFRFEVGHAVLGAKQLQDATQSLSATADEALFSFKKLGFYVAGSLGLGAGSMLSVLGAAVKSADKFRSSQISLASIMAANKDKLIGPIDTFNERMMVSEQILKDINKVANEFGLPAGELANMTKLIAPQLIGKGAAGKNLSGAIDISRGMLKAAPIMGINTMDAEGQLMRLIEGNASMGDTFFRRLVADTKSFGGLGKDPSKAINAMPAIKRINLLNKALGEFANNTDEVKANVQTLGAQMILLGDALTGTFSILKPIGDVVLVPIIKILKEANARLRSEGAEIAQNIANFIGPMIENPKKLLVNLMTLRELSNDTKQAGRMAGVIGIGLAIRGLLKTFPMLGNALGGLAARAAAIAGPFVGVILRGLAFILPKAVMFLGIAIARFLPLILTLVGIFQILSRASAIAKVKDMLELPKIMPKITELLTRMKTALAAIFSPLIEVIDAVAGWIAPLFQSATYLSVATPLLEGFVQVLEWLGKVVILARAGLEGLFFSIFQVVQNIRDGKFLKLGKGVGAAFDAGVNSIIEKNLSTLMGKDGAVVNQVTNIGKVEIKNSFRENLEPDRVAFELKEQLLKAALNPTQARGRNFSGAGAQ